MSLCSFEANLTLRNFQDSFTSQKVPNLIHVLQQGPKGQLNLLLAARLILQPHRRLVLFTLGVKLCSVARVFAAAVICSTCMCFSPQGHCLCSVWDLGSLLCSLFHSSLCFCEDQEEPHQPLKINPRLQYDFFSYTLFLCVLLLTDS